jgi:hypothetical protein
VSAGEGRTVGELLDDSDELAREALLAMSAYEALSETSASVEPESSYPALNPRQIGSRRPPAA